MFKKTNVSALIMEQLKDVEGCLFNFENYMRAAATPETAQETLQSLAAGVFQMEGAADRSLAAMIESLGSGSMLPATKEDLINIATSCDKIANKCEHVAMMMTVQKFRFPSQYQEDITKILTITHEAFEVLEKSIKRLFAKFGELLKDHSILYEIRELESQVDKIEQKLYADIFNLDMDLAHQTQLATFVELLCDLSDIIENIADNIQIMLITRKA
ncbi:MAG: TIGR00153 family protein [Clostridia bacterium]|nr:TIGR00153 family protein [Clostridia bacterium]